MLIAPGLSDLKAAATTEISLLYNGAPYTWTAGNYTGQEDNINVVKADSQPLTAGAWVRQGADKVSYREVGASPATIPLSDKVGQFVTPKGKAGSFLAQLNALASDFANGGTVHFPARNGMQTLTNGFTFVGQRLNMRGDGPNASVIQFNPVTPGSAITLNTTGAGGQYQSSISGFGFVSSNSVDKVAIDLVNTASVNIERVGIAGPDVWAGDSIGIRTRGRQMIRIKDCDIVCARPLVLAANPVWPTLAGDYTAVLNSELSVSDPLGAAIEVEDGVILSNLVVRDTALVGGLDAFRMKTTGAQIGVNSNWQFENIRTEQGTDPDGWSFDIEAGNNTLQSVVFSNLLLDSSRNGIRLRNAQRIILLGVNFNKLAENDHVALDIVGIPGTVLTMINCWAQTGSTVTLTNMKRVAGVHSDIGSIIGPVETWVYDAGSAFLGTGTTGTTMTDKSVGSTHLTLAANQKRLIVDASVKGQILVTTSEGPSCRFATYGNVVHKLVADDISARFSDVLGTALKHNVQYDATGPEGAGVYLENKATSTSSYSFTPLGSSW
jgi:hypothetical protein